MSSFDPITMEVIKNTLGSIADEMALVILRTSYSPIVRDSMDYSTGICDYNGQVVAHGLTCPLHIGAFPDAMAALLRDYGDDTNPGDMFIYNDPYGGGGMHLPDVYIIKPIFLNDRLEGYAVSLVHQTDVGGIAPGGNSVLAISNYQEGLRIPVIKLYERDRLVEQVTKIIAKNNRYPDLVAGDMRGQVAACKTAEKSFLEMLKKYGPDTIRMYTDHIHDYAEKMMREEIRKIPNGVYHYEDYIDGLGEFPTPILFKCKVTVSDEEVEIDWTGTSGVVKGAINCPIAFTHSSSFLALKCLVSPDVPNFQGMNRPIKTIAPLGTIVNPPHPAASNARAVCGYRMLDVIFGALAQAVPERVMAAGEGGVSFPAIGGEHNGERYVCTEVLAGTWGAMHDRDGVSGVANPGGNMTNQPVEMIEMLYPIEIEQYANIQNSGGPGKYRGATGYVRQYRNLGSEAVLTMRSDRRKHLPYGLDGGYSGTPCFNTFNPGRNDEKTLPTMPMERIYLQTGDSFRFMGAGGGGHGDPLEREPESVLRDVIEEYITEDYALEVYGVAVDLVAETIDLAATEAKRAELRAAEYSAVNPNTAYLSKYLTQHLGIHEFDLENGKVLTITEPDTPQAEKAE